MGFCRYEFEPLWKHKKHVQEFLNSKWNSPEWSLLSLQDHPELVGEVPFRNDECTRTRRCCGMCTRLCRSRCLQDSLHRVRMWRATYYNTPPEERNKLPEWMHLLVTTNFTSGEQLSYTVGDILSRKTNPVVKEYMEREHLFSQQNPYKIDYAPIPEVDIATGKRIVDRSTGRLQIAEWPKSGLCPYCAPEISVDRRVPALRRPTIRSKAKSGGEEPLR